MIYVCDLLNYTVNPTTGEVPMQTLTGSTPDISAFLQFYWFERVYFAIDNAAFPSSTNEQSGRSIGFAHHVGHSLTFCILTDDTRQVIHRSRVRSASQTDNLNARADKWGGKSEDQDNDPQEFVHTRTEELGINPNAPTSEDDFNNNHGMALINIDDMIGKHSISIIKMEHKVHYKLWTSSTNIYTQWRRTRTTSTSKFREIHRTTKM